MDKKLIILITIILALPFVFGSQGWYYEYGLGNDRTTIATGDIVFTTYDDYIVNLSIYNSKSEPIVADFIFGNERYEIALYGLCGVSIFDMNFTWISNYSTICSYSGRNISGITATDWNGDGYYDIFVSAFDSTQGYVYVIGIDINGTTSTMFSGTTTYSSEGKHPKCYGDYCYIQDINSNIYRFERNTGTKTQLNLGSLSGYKGEVLFSIDECDINNVGYELTTYGDFDDDGNCDDIALVKLSDFTLLRKKTDATQNEEILHPLTCGQSSGEYVVSVPSTDWTFWEGGGGWCTCANWDSLWIYNSTNLTLLGKPYTYYWTNLLYSPCNPAENCGDGGRELDLQYTTAIYGFYSDYICAGKNSKIECYDINGTLKIDKTSLAYIGQGGLTFADVNNDSQKDIITPSGIILEEDSFIIEVIITLPYTSTKGWIVIDDDTSYADLIGTNINSNGLYYIYSDGFGNVSNSMPYLLALNPSPDPQEINQLVEWFVSLNDDDDSSQLWTAFDCNNDGSLEYNWSKRGNGILFNCTYDSIGMKTGKVWYSDEYHYPSETSSTTDTVSIIQTLGGGCEGFIAPSCIGSCYFRDDFSYNNTILCNEWVGTNRTTTAGELVLYPLSIYDELYLSRISNPIKNWQWQTFTFQFDVNIVNDNYVRYFFYIFDKDILHELAFLVFDDGDVVAIDPVPPYETQIGTYSLNTKYTIIGVANFSSRTIKYYWNNSNISTQVEFNDLDTEDAGYFKFDWSNAEYGNWKLDNVLISYGNSAPEEESSPPPSEYNFTTEGANYLDTGNLCAINWSNHRFIESECALRGYSTRAEFLQLCLVRACFNDGMTYLFMKAQQNIFKTLVIIIVLLLVAPLIVRLITHRR